MALNFIDVVADLYGAGSPVTSGMVIFTPTSILTDVPDQEIITLQPVTAVFGTTGQAVAQLLAVDSTGPVPQGWAWEVSFRGVWGAPEPWSVQPAAGPASFTASGADPCVFTWSPTTYLTSLPDGTGVQLSGGSLPGGFSAGTTYYVVNSSGDTFELAATSGGSALASSSTGSGDVTVVQWNLSALAEVEPEALYQGYMPAPSGTPSAGQVPVATGYGQGSAWGDGGGASGVSSVFGRTGAVTAHDGDYTVSQVSGAAPLASPALTGTPTAPTAAPLTDDTRIATTAYVDAAVAAGGGGGGSVDSVFGRSGAVTAESGDYDVAEVTGAAPLVSPALTGAPVAPTQLPDDSSAKLATTAWVAAVLSAASSAAIDGGSGSSESGAAIDGGSASSGATGEINGGPAAVPVTAPLPVTGGTMRGYLAPAVVTLAQSGGSVAVNAAAGNDLRLTLTASGWTISAPTNPVDGQDVTFLLTQDSTGSRTVTWASGTGGFNFGSGSAPTLSTAANAADLLGFKYVAPLSAWAYLGATTGL